MDIDDLLRFPDGECSRDTRSIGRRDAVMLDVLTEILGQTRVRPGSRAVKDLNQELSYAELRERVSRLAQGFSQFGVGPGDRVALLIPNSVDFIVAALASLWIGAVFVPLAVTDPQARLVSIVADSAPTLILSPSVPDESPYTALGDSQVVRMSDIAGDSTESLPPLPPSRRVAYTIYTSGTTGTPKGVQIGTRAFGAAVEATIKALDLDHDTVTLCVSPFHFDGSFATLFPTLAAGGTVIIPPRDALLFPRTFFNAVVSEGVTYTGFSPSYLRILLASPLADKLANSKVNVIALGGEAASIADVRALWSIAPHLRVFNRYGPTETTIVVTHQLLRPELLADGEMPLGRPHAGSTFHIVNDDGALLNGTHEVGELWIGGLQLMDGYWGAPELTASVLRNDVVAGEVVYRTGDLVYRDENDNFVYVDRADRVVKRSGVRISLVEMSETIRSLDNVTAATCLTFDDEGDLGIVAFVVALSQPTAHELLKAAREKLPDTMLPDRVEFVDALPLTSSGKIDERLLRSQAGLQPARRTATDPGARSA